MMEKKQNKLYLILLSTDLDREKVISALNESNKLDFWFYNLPYSVFIRTELSPVEILRLIDSKMGEKRVFITEIANKYYGRLPKKHWNYFKND